MLMYYAQPFNFPGSECVMYEEKFMRIVIIKKQGVLLPFQSQKKKKKKKKKKKNERKTLQEVSFKNWPEESLKLSDECKADLCKA